MRSAIFLKLLLKMASEAGDVSLRLMSNSHPSLKPDNSVLTKADMTVSRLIRRQLKPFLKTQQHLLIDEEDQQSAQYLNQQVLEKPEYIWVVDPIDGTRSFSNRLPLWGVSLGVLKDLKPWLGVVYFPALQEMLYCDGKRAYYVQQPFSKKARRRLLKPVDQSITRQSVFFGNDLLLKRFEWDYEFCQLMIVSCAALDLCWPALGRAAGSFFKSNLWDFAGSWPIVHQAGLRLRSLKASNAGKTLDSLNAADYISEGHRAWRLKEPHVLSSERNFELFKTHLRAKGA